MWGTRGNSGSTGGRSSRGTDIEIRFLISFSVPESPSIPPAPRGRRIILVPQNSFFSLRLPFGTEQGSKCVHACVGPVKQLLGKFPVAQQFCEHPLKGHGVDA